MKIYSLSKTTVPANGSAVGTLQPTATEARGFQLKNSNPPANYASNSAAAPTVQASPVRRRRPIMLIAS